MNRTTLTLIGAVTALAAVTGAAALSVPDEEAPAHAPTAARLPVERTTLACPPPADSELAETDYTAVSPGGKAAGKGKPGGAKGGADLLPAPEGNTGEDGGKKDGKDEEDGKDGEDGQGGDDGGKDTAGGDPVLSVEEPGKPVTSSADRSDAPALTGSAEGPLAPGWTVQQTTTITAGTGRGLYGTSCSAPDTDFWFPGVSTADDRQDYLHLTNPDDTTALVDLELYGKKGTVRTDTGEGISVPPRSTIPVLLNTLTTEPVDDVTVHAVVRSGRVGAQVQAVDEKRGGDWLPPAAVPRSTVVLPGIPAEARSVRLVVHAPSDRDADLQVRLATPTGKITPAGHETLHVKAGMTAAVELAELTRGEAGSLVLSPTDEDGGGARVVASARVLTGAGGGDGKDDDSGDSDDGGNGGDAGDAGDEGDEDGEDGEGGGKGKPELAFVPATAAVVERTTAAGSGPKGTTLSLVAPGAAVKVRVTASAGSEGGEPSSRTYTVKAGTTRAIEPPQPKGGKGTHALTVERLSGGDLYAARTLSREEGGVPMVTVQTLPDDRGTVTVPQTEQDLSLLTR